MRFGHAQLCHTLCHTSLSHIVSRGAVALGDIHLRFAWQAWCLAPSTFVFRGRRGTWRHPRATFHFYCHGQIFGDIGGLAMLVAFACDIGVLRLR